jgi:hypothetical protein
VKVSRYPHFTKEETEAQRREGIIYNSRPHNGKAQRSSLRLPRSLLPEVGQAGLIGKF